MLLGNAEIKEKERMAVLDRLEKFFRDILKYGNANEAAVSVEKTIYMATNTKEEYKRMIMSKMQHLQQQHQQRLPGGIVQHSQPTNPTEEYSKSERAEMRSLVVGMQSKIPMIDSIIAQNSNFTSMDPDVIRKYASLRNILVKQISMMSPDGAQDTFIMSLSNMNAVIDQLNKMTEMFSKAYRTTIQSTIFNKKLQEYRKALSMSGLKTIQKRQDNGKIVNVDYVRKELAYLAKIGVNLEYSIEHVRTDRVNVQVYLGGDKQQTINFQLKSDYPGDFTHNVSNFEPSKPMSLCSFIRQYIACNNNSV